MDASRTSPVIILSTVGEEETARRLGRSLVEGGLAACVVRFPVASVYRWQGAVEEAQEWQLMIKTSSAMRDGVEREVRRIGGYELPEFVVIESGVTASADYLAWLLESCGQSS